MRDIFENYPGAYCAHWSLAGMYDDAMGQLMEAIDSGENFTANWGCKKEIHYATITRIDGKMFISCVAFIDELPDLVDTMIWRAVGGNDVCDSGYDWVCKHHDLDPEKDADKAQEIMEEIEGWIVDQYSEDYEAHTSAMNPDYDEVMKMVDKCEDEAAEKAEKAYQDMVETIRDCMDAYAESQQAPWA